MNMNTTYEYSTNPQDDHAYTYGTFASIVVCIVPLRSSDDLKSHKVYCVFYTSGY